MTSAASIYPHSPFFATGQVHDGAMGADRVRRKKRDIHVETLSLKLGVLPRIVRGRNEIAGMNGEIHG